MPKFGIFTDVGAILLRLGKEYQIMAQLLRATVLSAVHTARKGKKNAHTKVIKTRKHNLLSLHGSAWLWPGLPSASDKEMNRTKKPCTQMDIYLSYFGDFIPRPFVFVVPFWWLGYCFIFIFCVVNDENLRLQTPLQHLTYISVDLNSVAHLFFCLCNIFNV